jgi:hypothetical protein
MWRVWSPPCRTRSTATSQRTRDKLQAIADARGMSVSKLSRKVLDEFVKRETLEQ